MAVYCLLSRRRNAFVVSYCDGDLLRFDGRMQAWLFKARLAKWHWDVAPANEAPVEVFPPQSIPTLYDVVR